MISHHTWVVTLWVCGSVVVGVVLVVLLLPLIESLLSKQAGQQKGPLQIGLTEPNQNQSLQVPHNAWQSQQKIKGVSQLPPSMTPKSDKDCSSPLFDFAFQRPKRL